MSSFDISSLQGKQLQTFAQKCDVNGNGKIDENELSIFEEGKSSLNSVNDNSIFTIGGVELKNADVKSISKNNDGDKFDYSVNFNNGVKAQFARQAEGNEAALSSDSPYSDSNFTHASNFADGEGIEIKGSRKNDVMYINNSKISSIDGSKGDDTVVVDSSIGTTNNSNIFAEKVCASNSTNLTIKDNNIKQARGGESQAKAVLTENNQSYISKEYENERKQYVAYYKAHVEQEKMSD